MTKEIEYNAYYIVKAMSKTWLIQVSSKKKMRKE